MGRHSASWPPRDSLLPLSAALKSPLKVKMALERWWGRDKEESSDGAGTPGSDPGSDPGYALTSLSFGLLT